MYRVSRRGISNFGCQPSLRNSFNGNLNRPNTQTPQKIGDVTISQMSNGARIVTQELNEPTSAVGLYCLAGGAKYDPSSKPGLNYVMRYSLMTSNMADSIFQLDKAVRSVGGSIEHQEIRKQYLGWKLEVRRDAFQKSFNIMQNCITVPRFAESDTNRFRDTMDAVLEELRWQQPRTYAIELLEQEAYYKEPCGNPRYVPPTANDDCTHEALLEKWGRTFIPKNIVISGVNVDHSALLAAYENAEFSHSATAPHFRNSQELLPLQGEVSQFQAGRDACFTEKRYKEMSTKPFLENETISAIGWRSFGYDNSVKEFATGLVAQQFIDIAIQDGIRVEEGIDKGLRSFYSPMSSIGLIGITIRTEPEVATAALKSAIEAMKSASTNKDALAAAITRAQVRFLHDNIETRRDYIDFLATSIGNSGAKQIRTVESTIEAIKAVTIADVQNAFKDSLAQSPCMYVMGDTNVPSLRQLGLSK